MKRKCVDSECKKKFVVSRDERRQMKEMAPYKGDENLCHSCFKDVCAIAREQSYFGSIKEWGRLNKQRGEEMRVKCDACKGTGLLSAKPLPYPYQSPVIGTWNCQYCNGTGEGVEITYSNNTITLSKPKS